MTTVRSDLGNLRESARRTRVEPTGGITATNVQKALEALSGSIPSLPMTVAQGGTGATTVAGAQTNLAMPFGARLAKTTAYTVAITDDGSTIALDSAAFYALTFPLASGLNATHKNVVINEDQARGKTLIQTLGTSATSFLIGTGSKAFTTQAGLDFIVGRRVRAWSLASSANWMSGLITAYSGTTLTVLVDAVGGSGTLTDWQIGREGILWPRQSTIIYNDNNVWRSLISERFRLFQATTINFDPLGLPNNDGLATGAGGALPSIQSAWDLAADMFDAAGKGLTFLSSAAATWTNNGLLTNKPILGQASAAAGVLDTSVVIDGNGSTFNRTDGTYNFMVGSLITSGGGLPVRFTLRNMTITGTGGSGGGGVNSNGGTIAIGDLINFGTCQLVHMLSSGPGANVYALSQSYTISGGAQAHIQAWSGAIAVCQSCTVTLTGTPAFVTGFAVAGWGGGGVFAAFSTFTGAATGKRYSIHDGGIIDTQNASQTFLPGSLAGVNTGGWYAGSLGTTNITGNNGLPALTTAGTLLDVVGTDATIAAIEIDSFAAQGALFFRRADTTMVAPSAVQNDEAIGGVQWLGYGASAYSLAARAVINGVAGENWSNTQQGTYLALYTTAAGGTSVSEKMRLHGSGGLAVGSVTTDPGANNVGIAGAAIVPSVIGGTAVGATLSLKSTSGVGTTDAIKFLTGNSGGTEGMRVQHSGQVAMGTTVTSADAPLTLNQNTALPAALIGTPAFHLIGADSGIPGITIDAAANSAAIYLRRANGTIASPSATVSGNSLGTIGWSGFGSTIWAVNIHAGLVGVASETWTDTANGAGIDFYATANGTISVNAKARLQNSGGFSLGTGSIATDPGAGNLLLSGFVNSAGGHKRVSTQFDKTTDTTLADVTGLSVTLIAGQTYAFEAMLYTSSNVAGGVKAAIAGTATATAIVYEALVWNAAALSAQTRSTALAGAVGGVTAVTVAQMRITGTITVNAAGTMTVQFAQNASNGAASSVLVGSTFKVWQIT